MTLEEAQIASLNAMLDVVYSGTRENDWAPYDVDEESNFKISKNEKEPYTNVSTK